MDKDTKAKIIVGAVIMTVVLFIVVYGVIAFGDKNTTPKKYDSVAFSAPILEKKQYEYNRRIDQINEKGYTQQRNENTHKKVTDIKENTTIENPFFSEVENLNQVPKTTEKTKLIIGQERCNTITSTQSTRTYNQIQENIKYDSPVLEPTKRRKKRYLNDTTTKKSDLTSHFNISESIPCKIYGDHKVTNNSKIRARITQDITIGNVKIKRNTIISGIVRLSSSKVNITFETIQYQNKIIPANMKAYSRDGLEGIYIEGGISDDIKKDSYDDIIDAASPSTMDRIPIVGDLLKATSKSQNNRVYVNIPNDYTIYLKK